MVEFHVIFEISSDANMKMVYEVRTVSSARYLSSTKLRSKETDPMT